MERDLSDLAGTRRARQLLTASEKSMEDLLAALEFCAEQMLGGEMPSLTDVAKARVALATARTQLLEEVKKHEDRCAFDRGLVATAPLDFDELRGEIGRKLDRLRDEGEAEGLS